MWKLWFCLSKGSGIDIRVQGSCADMMTTSFQSEWSDDEDSSNSSEEFMYVKGGDDNRAEMMLGKFFNWKFQFETLYLNFHPHKKTISIAKFHVQQFFFDLSKLSIKLTVEIF